MGKVSNKISWEITKKTFLPVLIFALIISVYVFYRLNLAGQLSEQLNHNLKKYFLTVLIISVAFVFQRLITGIAVWYKENIASRTYTQLDDQLIPLLKRVSKIAVWVITLLIILPIYGVNISALIATLGVSSLAVALAAQDTIANIISGFMIMVDSPFRLRDRIKLPSGEIVTVLEIGIRRSKFLSQDNAIVIVPNLELSKSKIVNYTYGEERLNK